jgi:heptosyltransferase-1
MRKDGLGDCIIFYPTLRAYREYYADAKITLIFPAYFISLAPLLGKDLVDRVVWFDHKRFGSDISYRRRFLLDLKQAGYDISIYPVYSAETIGHFMIKMTGAAERIGFGNGSSLHIYTRLISPPEAMRLEIDRDIYFAEKVTGRKIKISFPTIDVRRLPSESAGELLAEHSLIGKKYAVIFPGAGAPYRIWPIDKLSKVINYITSKGITAVICGSDKERPLAQKLLSSLKSAGPNAMYGRVIDLSGKTDLSALAHVLSGAQLYFGSDTGILHLAVAVGTPSIAIVGAGGLDRFFPYGDLGKNRAIIDTTRSYVTGTWADADTLGAGEIHPSIKNITVEDAEKQIDHFISHLI